MAGGGIKINNTKIVGGADGRTPVFKIENGILFNSYDNGRSWSSLGNVKGEQGIQGMQGEKGDRGEKGANGGRRVFTYNAYAENSFSNSNYANFDISSLQGWEEGNPPSVDELVISIDGVIMIIDSITGQTAVCKKFGYRHLVKGDLNYLCELKDFGRSFSASKEAYGGIELASNTGALDSRQDWAPVLGSNMDEAWKYVATAPKGPNYGKWTDEDWEKFYDFIGAVKDYHNNRNGIVRYNDGKISMTYPTQDHHGATMKYVKDRVADKVADALESANTEAHLISNAALGEAMAYANSVKTKVVYKTCTGGEQHKLKIGAWYMVFCNDNSLRVCKADGTAVVTGAKQLLFMSVPYSEFEKELFVIMGLYAYDGKISLTDLKAPMQFIQLQVNAGSYITADVTATFNVSEMGS